jgi:outer membrane protein assembly factor BamB
MTPRWLFAPLFTLIVAGISHGENWPSWRGPTGQGRSADPNPPLKWTASDNVRWKAPLPDIGNGSPIIWGNRVFITQATDRGKRRGVICFDRSDGRKLWERYVEFSGKEPTHETNPFCSATPATDGERVYASLGSAGLICLDLDGKELWKKDLGELIHIWGNASSPIIHGELVILWCGPGERQFLVAFDKRNGKEIWRHEEPGGKSGLGGKGGDDWIGSWSTPIVAKVAGREELVLTVPHKVKAFDSATGKELWSCEGLGNLAYTSPAISEDGIVLAMSGYGGPALAVKAGGDGDVTNSHRLWRQEKQNPQRIGSAVILSGRAYLMNEPGLASCFDLKSGKDVWDKDRLTGQTWSSMVAAADRLYVTNTSGETLVIQPGDKPKVLAKNPLDEKVLASIAISDGELFIRGYKHLWCIGETKPGN